MPALATWLVTSTANAVLALGGSLIVPLLQPIGAIFLGMLVIARGVRVAAVLALLAAAAVAIFSPLLGSTPLQIAVMVAVTWLPVVLLAAIWLVSGSMLLAMQISVLAAVAAMLVFHVTVDVDAFWAVFIDGMNAAYQAAGVASPFEIARSNLASSPVTIAQLMTPAYFASLWLLAVLAFILGGGLYNKLPGDRPRFGRFRDLDFGRILAGLYAIVLFVAFASSSSTLWQAGAILTTVFVLQGLVVMHWLHLERHAPVLVVLVTYALLLVAFQYALAVLAVVGFMDALFRIRRRWLKSKGSKK